MTAFTKLVPEILQSSLWNESSDIRIVWITLLAAKDKNGYVRGDVVTISRLANVSLEATQEALDKFQREDCESHTPDNDGKRIEKAPGGWLILNHALYRDRDFQAEHAEYMRNWRKNRGVKKRDSQVNNASVSVSVSDRDKGCGEKGNGDQLEDFISELKKIYTWLDIDREISKMQAWLLTPKGKGRKLTKRFAVNWLNKSDAPLNVAESQQNQSLQPVQRESVFTLEKRIAAAKMELDKFPKYQADQSQEQKDRIRELRKRISEWQSQIAGG